MLELSTIWAGIIAFAVLTYVILDGFDLGVGILFPFAKTDKDRDVMMNSVTPVWDGNETWLVMGGGGLFAVFPLAYSVVMPAIYMPIIIMLLALVFRGVAFEYRWRTVHGRWLWDVAFHGGSTVASLCQGIALGALVQGITVEDRQYAGGWWDWLTPFSVLTGVALVIGYALLGATWLNMKTTGAIQRQMRRYARPLMLAAVGSIGLVSLLTPYQDTVYLARWFSWPGVTFSVIVPAVVTVIAWTLHRGLRDRRDYQPFFCAIGLFVVCFIGIGISFYPYVLPPSLTIAEAAAPNSSLGFALVGAATLLPVILAYTAYTYWVFRGKIDPEESYH